MANKFTKSVLERQAKEAKKEAKDARLQSKATAAPSLSAEPKPSADSESELKNTPKSSTTSTATVQAPPASTPKRTRTKSSGQVDLSAFIIRNTERSAKNKTFYLDAAVIDAIKSAASAQKVTDSKLVNDILKTILGVT